MKYKGLLLLLLLVFGKAQAIAWGTDCNYETNNQTVTIPSGIKISVDPNDPLGTVYYRQTVNSGNTGSIVCGTANSYTLGREMAHAFGGDTVTMTGGSFYNTYNVYKTNVSGLGLVAWRAGNVFPYNLGSGNDTNHILNVLWTGMVFDISLVKYAEIPAGAHTVNISSTTFPDALQNVILSNSADTTRMPNGKAPLMRYTFSGSISVVSGTCDTPDMQVILGTRKKNDPTYREGGKFASPWVDASIRLTGCPVFHGTGDNSDATRGTTRNNIMTITLIPGNATTSNQGIMPLDVVSNGATGVGIQVAWGTAASNTKVDFSSGKGSKTYTMNASQGSNYTVPLVARYMQTAATLDGVTAGHANGKMTYLMSYH